jgi:hypothetical protein
MRNAMRQIQSTRAFPLTEKFRFDGNLRVSSALLTDTLNRYAGLSRYGQLANAVSVGCPMELPTRARRNLASPSPAKPASQPQGVGADPPASFDDWLDGRLKNLYQAVVNEPLPDEIMTLLTGQKKPGGTK